MPQDSAFRQLFPQPTGQNGLEELLYGAELLEKSRAGQSLNEAPDTVRLAELEIWLNDATVRKALALVRAGLQKGVRSPHGALTPRTLFPEFAPLRRLGRLLRQQTRVSYSLGRHPEAARAIEDGLRLSQMACYDVLIGGLVGIAIQSLTLDGAMRFQSAWSQPDCERLLRFTRELLAAPDPLPPLLDGEAASFETLTMLFEKDPKKALDELLPEGDEDGPGQQELRGALLALASDAPGRARAAQEARAAFAGELAVRKRYLSDPTLPLPTKNSSVLLDALMPNWGLVCTRFVQSRVRLRLFGVHAALQRHWWELGSYPEGLGELKLGDFPLDPCTRQPLLYKRSASGYELSSAGPHDPEKSGQRLPVTLTARKVESTR